MTFQELDQFMDNIELVQGAYFVDENAKQRYIEAVEIAKSLSAKGKCSLQFSDPEKPYALHTIELIWKPDDMGWYEMDCDEIIPLLSKTNRLLVDENTWQLSVPVCEELSNHK